MRDIPAQKRSSARHRGGIFFFCFVFSKIFSVSRLYFFSHYSRLPYFLQANAGIAAGFSAYNKGRKCRKGGAFVRLSEESFAALGVSADVVAGGAKVVVYAGVCACFENVKGIVRLSAEEVVLRAGRGEVCVRGKNLRVARYGLGDLWLSGSVTAVEISEETP